jgi:hypothetical protein
MKYIVTRKMAPPARVFFGSHHLTRRQRGGGEIPSLAEVLHFATLGGGVLEGWMEAARV